MSTLEQINKTERLLYAAKTNLKYMKNRRWIAENYKNEPSGTDTQIQQTEAEITRHRKQLKELYSTIDHEL